VAGLVSPATLEQIRAASDIVDVIGASLPLKRAGANFLTLCPFHREKTPSFNVNPHKQIFHCFGCHKGGDVFRFIQEYENLSFVEAVRRLAERAGIPLEFDRSAEGQQTRYLKETLWQIHEGITQRWHAALLNDAAGQIARDYLAKRGVSDEAVKLFRLGYAPDLWDDTVNWAKSKNYEPATMEQAGLIIRRENAEGHYDRFRGRLMFPICDEQGRVIAFSGRVLTGDEKTAKYVNSPETPIFTKSRVFFGLDKTKRAILDAEFAIVCEGQLDLIACYMAGVRNIVAPQGTAFTSEHARVLKRYVNEVVLCFDSDNAGQNAAVRVLDSLAASGLAVRVATVPAPHDPDSFIKEFGGPAFQKLIADAPGFFDFYLNRLCATNDPASDKGRLVIVSSMSEALARTGNAVLLDTYAAKTAQRLGVSVDAMRAEFRKGAGRHRPREEPERPTEATQPVISPTEFMFLRLLLDGEEHVPWIAQHLDPIWLKNELVQTITRHRLALHLQISGRANRAGEPAWTSVSAFLQAMQNPAAEQLVSEVLTRPLLQHRDGTSHVTTAEPARNIEQLGGILLKFRNDYLDSLAKTLDQQLADPALPDEKRNGLVMRRHQITLQKKTSLQPLEETNC
jgi:DNA primase